MSSDVVVDFLNFLPSRRPHTSQYGELAQLGERLVCNQEVTGSSPVFSTLFSLRSPLGFAGSPGAPTPRLATLVRRSLKDLRFCSN